jgi:hypothetical protein
MLSEHLSQAAVPGSSIIRPEHSVQFIGFSQMIGANGLNGIVIKKRKAPMIIGASVEMRDIAVAVQTKVRLFSCIRVLQTSNVVCASIKILTLYKSAIVYFNFIPVAEIKSNPCS